MNRSTESSIQARIDNANYKGKISSDYLEQLVSIQVKAGHLAAHLQLALECEREHETSLVSLHKEHYYDGLVELAAECIRAMERIRMVV